MTTPSTHVTVTHGMKGFYAVIVEKTVDGWDVLQTGFGAYESVAEAAKEAVMIADNEGLLYKRQAFGIYVASKAARGPEWQERRRLGLPIISTWIDESAEGTTMNWPGLWSRCITEAALCRSLVVVRYPGEMLKGAMAEVGAALAMGTPVFAFGLDVQDSHQTRQTIWQHPGVTNCNSADEAFEKALALCPGGRF